MIIYNASLYLVFFTFYQFMHTTIKTLYSFTDLGSSNFFTKVLIIALFSMAGVPPFWGFFSKVFIFTLLCGSNFFILYPIFFLLLFIGLYFYIQNIRFLNSTASSNFNPIVDVEARVVTVYYPITLALLFFITFGVFFTEDLILTTTWVLL